ncbi:MAG: exodeoxyribonuclease VII large subunit, partial [Pseudomonadota bacterium]
MLAQSETRPVLSVSALARDARLLIEEHFQLVWVRGELSNFRRPGSGHWYFTLKDEQAQLRCAMFAGRNRAVRFRPQDGAEVIVRGRVSLYEPRGDFQVIAEHMEPAGEGALRAAFEALKERLSAEGLFDPERKRALPVLPQRLAVISSASGAALRDVLHVIERRFPALEVILLPVAVQGEQAEGDVLAALERVPQLDPDVVLLTRGGGSLEDLWTFNTERVARAVAACPFPTVSAVGHQTDVTITDFAADHRAPTPSAGAELITPDRRELLGSLTDIEARLARELHADVRGHRRHLQHLRARLVDPRRRLAQQMQRADELDERLRRATAARIDARHRQLHA